eukprot:gene14427-30708_t
MQKIEEGKLELILSNFELNTLLRKVQSTLRGSLNNKEISLIINIANDVSSRFIGDSFQIKHVLANFLSNAIKFSSFGSSIIIEITDENISNNTNNINNNHNNHNS